MDRRLMAAAIVAVIILAAFAASMMPGGSAEVITTWETETVGQAGPSMTRLAIDGSGVSHITGSLSGLVYFKDRDTYWKDLSGTSFGGSTSEAQYSDIGIDGTGKIHIVTSLGSTGINHYTSINGGGSLTTAVKIHNSTAICRDISMVIDSQNRLWISFTNNGLWVLHWDGSAWVSEQLTNTTAYGSSIAIGQGDVVGISSFTTAAESYGLNYYQWDGSSWTGTLVCPNQGEYSSMGFIGANPCISFYNSLKLGYAEFNGTAWNVENVDTSVTSIGQYTSLVISNGEPHISYYDVSNKDLKYAYRSGSTWTKETVDSSGDVGQWSSMAFHEGMPRISYIDSSNARIKHAVFTAHWSPTFTSVPGTAVVEDSPYSYTPQINETGTISALTVPSWASWDGTTLSGTPGTGDAGVHEVSFSATGSGGLTSWSNYTITVAERPRWAPQVTSVPDTLIAGGGAYSYLIEANESVTIEYSGPEWLTLDGALLSGTAPSITSNHEVSLSIRSSQGTLTLDQSWNVTVLVWDTTVSVQLTANGLAVSASYQLSDPSLSWAIGSVTWDFGDGSPPVNGSSASHTYATAGTYAVNCNVTNALGNETEGSSSITLRKATAPSPVIPGGGGGGSRSGSSDRGSSLPILILPIAFVLLVIALVLSTGRTVQGRRKR